ncbi:PA14 domain-containing protein [Pedobacter yulinensis]|nr:PA14 domain-containing protein [Pedobacter yulinensis]
MTYIKKLILAAAVLLPAVAYQSCKQSQLEDLSLPPKQPNAVTGEGIVLSDVEKGNDIVSVPFSVTLEKVAAEAFEIGITLNNDTVTGLINSGALPNAMLMPAQALELPNVINISYGTNTGRGVAKIRRYVLERNFGKTLAFALRLAKPGKGNRIASGKSNILVVMNTTQLLKPEELHYLSLPGSNGTYNISYKNNYTVGLSGITIPLTISLSNQASTAFTVAVKENRDTVARLIAEGKLPADVILLKPEEYILDTIARVGTGLNTGVARLQIPWPVFDANIVANKKFAFAVSLQNPTNHVLHPVNSRIIIVVDPNVNLDNNSYITGNGTGLKAEYFTDNQLLNAEGKTPKTVRIDAEISFSGDDWPRGAGLSLDNFSSKWTGEFLAPVRGEYIFYQTRWDDGSRLYVNGVALVDDFTTRWDLPTRTGKIVLERGKRYKIEAHHRENVGGQQAYLEFEVPAAGISKRLVPKSQLFPAP